MLAERVCCLLVLDSVTSTPQWIRNSRSINQNKNKACQTSNLIAVIAQYIAEDGLLNEFKIMWELRESFPLYFTVLNRRHATCHTRPTLSRSSHVRDCWLTLTFSHHTCQRLSWLDSTRMPSNHRLLSSRTSITRCFRNKTKS